VFPLGELLDHLLVERGDVVRLAARDDPVVDDDFLVDPVSAGVPDVRLQCRPGRWLARRGVLSGAENWKLRRRSGGTLFSTRP
jgi:hypothetical protein